MTSARPPNSVANFAASLIGNASAMAVNLICVPFYVRLMGIEAYGLVGVFATMQVMFNVLDLGLTPTINRELAVYSARPERVSEARDLVRTLEFVYWAAGVAIGLVTIGVAPLVAHKWVHTVRLQDRTVQNAIALMGVAFALQWGSGFYSAGLQGLQRLVLVNAIRIATTLVRYAGAALVLWTVAPTITVFAGWQIVASIIQTAVTALALWRSLPAAGHRPQFRAALVKRVWRFAAAVSGIMVLTLIITQLDKIILSKLLPLDLFGYYTLAGVVSTGVMMFIGSVSTFLFPAMSRLVARGDERALARLYHLGCQLMSVLVLPIAITIALFSRQLLLVWTGNPATADNTRVIASILAVGMGLVSLNHLPYALQLAHGWTRITFYARIVELVISVPMIFVLTAGFGAAGGAVIWIISGAGYIVIVIPLMHRRLLTNDLRHWYLQDALMPLAAASAVIVTGWWLIPESASSLITIATIGPLWLLGTAAACAGAPQLRTWMGGRIGWPAVAVQVR